MEREFLTGINFRLSVDKLTYDSWLQLLKGLVLAKEREYQQWLSMRRKARTSTSATGSRVHRLNTDIPEIRVPHRRRSTSPRNATVSRSSAFTFTLPTHLMPSAYPQSSPLPVYAMDAEDGPMYSGMKRSADSGADYDTLYRPTKRVAALQTERLPTSGGPRSAGPAFSSSVGSAPVDAFSSLSITNLDAPSTHSLHNFSGAEISHHQTSSLAQPYPLDQIPLNSQPQVSSVSALCSKQMIDVRNRISTFTDSPAPRLMPKFGRLSTVKRNFDMCLLSPLRYPSRLNCHDCDRSWSILPMSVLRRCVWILKEHRGMMSRSKLTN